MFRTSSTFDKLLEKATSNLLLEPDWPSILLICDLIRQNDVQPKYAILAIKKRLYSPNPHCAMYALQVLESIVKNCGSAVHDELTTKTNCEMLRELAKTSLHENVRQKVLELIQAWTFAFRKTTKYRSLKDTMNLMKTEGFKFPTLRESDAMFSADSAPEWTDGDVCHRCRVAFSFVQRKHHCRACGNVFCHQCSQKTTTLPKFGIEKEVRVCDSCYEQSTKPTTAIAATPAPAEKEKDTDLPAEYLASSLAQQNQVPPRKTEEELREEEELQLALALSKSEAEHKEKEKMRVTSALHANTEARQSPVNNPVPRSPSPQEDQNMDPELARYLNRTYWESRHSEDVDRPASPSAPSPLQNNVAKPQVNGITDPEMEEFVQTLKSQVEIFVNRMKSNSSRGRSVANDSSVQTLFMNITAMHSRLLRYIQQQDDARLHYEGLQDKLTQVKDARAALDDLREEHREQLRRQAEEAERQRQLQMAHKLEIMRKKKQEYLQYQHQLALQRVQEQEREMQMRQEQQKQQYLMGPQYGYMGSPVHGNTQQYRPQMGSASMYYPFNHPVMNMQTTHVSPQSGNQPLPSMGPPVMHPPQGAPSQGPIPMGMGPQQSQQPTQGPPPPGVHSIPPMASMPPQSLAPAQQVPAVAHVPNNPQSAMGIPMNAPAQRPNTAASQAPIPPQQYQPVSAPPVNIGAPQQQPQPPVEIQNAQNNTAELISFD
ncbi:Hepatocyte growth factor regulated tyrosine kinase substrate [Carabus blaptoides fortunei]